jgi:repressor of nif and glnA expression
LLKKKYQIAAAISEAMIPYTIMSVVDVDDVADELLGVDVDPDPESVGKMVAAGPSICPLTRGPAVRDC